MKCLVKGCTEHDLLEAFLPEIVNGEFVWTKECVPIELLRQPAPPRSTSLEDLQRSVDELKDEVERLKSERH